MPFYRITLKLRPNRIISGIRQLETYDIDQAWRHFEYQTRQNIPECELLEFDCVMVSKLSNDVKLHHTKLARKGIEQIPHK